MFLENKKFVILNKETRRYNREEKWIIKSCKSITSKTSLDVCKIKRRSGIKHSGIKNGQWNFGIRNSDTYFDRIPDKRGKWTVEPQILHRVLIKESDVAEIQIIGRRVNSN